MNPVPSIDVACQELQIPSDRKVEFLRSTDKYRQEHKFSDDSLGKDLVDWYSLQTSKRFSNMCRAYLSKGHREMWWPPPGMNSTQANMKHTLDNER